MSTPRTDDRSREAQGPPEIEAPPLSLLRLATTILRHRVAFVVLPVGLALTLVLWALAQPATYTASFAFVPQNGEMESSRIAGLAAQLGVVVPRSGSGQSSAFYADLLSSRELLRGVVEHRYAVATDGRQTADLTELLDARGDDRDVRVANAIDRLAQLTRVEHDATTGIVEFSVRSRGPELAQEIAARALEGLHGFNLEIRRSRASAEKDFVESQVESAEAALLAAEDSLQAFLQRNRRYENSPDLIFEHDRLQRRVGLRQQVFTALSQSLEQARIDEVRNTPVITVVEPPPLPVRPDSRWLLLRVVVGLVVGGILGLLWSFGRDGLQGARAREPDVYRELSQLREETRSDLRSLLRAGRRSRRQPTEPESGE